MNLNDYEIILASGSPRRKDFLESLKIPFTIKTHWVDESFPPELKGNEIAEFIVRQKNAPLSMLSNLNKLSLLQTPSYGVRIGI